MIRTSRGLEELANADIGISHTFAEMAKRVRKGVICLISALQFHEITLQAPRSFWVAIGEKALSIAVKTYVIDAVPVRIFDPAKTVVDCFRYRRTVGLDVALEALRLALTERKTTPAEIAYYSRQLRIWSVMRPYLESVAANEW